MEPSHQTADQKSQCPSGDDVMQYNLSDSDPITKWKSILEGKEQFDYIVMGSGFTGYAFCEQIFASDLNPRPKILMLERGPFFLPDHFQNLPLSFKVTLGNKSETFPFTLTEETKKAEGISFCHGSCPFVGGRSSYWSAWCPRVEVEDQIDWPEEFAEIMKSENFWKGVETLLSIKTTDQICTSAFSQLQPLIFEQLKSRGIFDKYTPEYARLSVGNDTSKIKFCKYSVQYHLLELHQQATEYRRKEQKKLAEQSLTEEQYATQKEAIVSPLQIFLNTIVQKIVDDPFHTGRAMTIQTSRGDIPVGGAKIILAGGMLPTTTLLLNSYPTHTHEFTKLVGNRLAGHFQSLIAARFPKQAYFDKDSELSKQLHIGAFYVPGLTEDHGSYHAQVTMIHTPNPDDDAADAARQCPDYAAAATYEQLQDSQDHIVLVIALLGAFETTNPHNMVKLNSHHDVTTNLTVQFVPTEKDYALWDHMEAKAISWIKAMSKDQDDQVEFWQLTNTEIPYSSEGYWAQDIPTKKMNRMGGIVHESSTTWVGKKGQAPVGFDFRPHGLENVYVTGGGIFPTAGSWNNTAAMVGYAQHLAKTLLNSQRLQE